MALIVEDGTGKPDAESYLSTADASERLGQLGYSAFTDLVSSDPDKAEAFLRRSTKIVDAAVDANPRGRALDFDQALALPRSGLQIRGRLLPYDEVPEVALELCAIGAEVEAQSLATAAATTPADDPNVKRIRRSSTAEVEFFAGTRISEERRALAAEFNRLSDELRFDNPGSLP